jgi:putative hemolysin
MFSGFGIPDSHMVVGMVSLGKMYFSNRGGKMKPRRRKDVINWVD